jgi:chemotaxis protein MotB
MNSRPARKHPNHERWLVSYADLLTLLFAVFVVLYASSKADEKKRMMVSKSIKSAFTSLGMFSPSAPPPGGSANSTDLSPIPDDIVLGQQVLSPAKVQENLDHIRRELEQVLSSQIAQHNVSIQMGRDGLIISLREAGFFDSGSASPKPETLATLRQIATLLGSTRYNLRIEGHTDNVPIHTAEFDSNWELSSARATRIARLFLEMNTIPPERLSAAGYAEFHPVASNATEEGRAANRRVDLVVLPGARIDLAMPSPPPSSPQATGAWRKVTDDDAPAPQP